MQVYCVTFDPHEKWGESLVNLIYHMSDVKVERREREERALIQRGKASHQLLVFPDSMLPSFLNSSL